MQVKKYLNRDALFSKEKRMRAEKNMASLFLYAIGLVYLLILTIMNGYKSPGYTIGGAVFFLILYGLFMGFLFIQGTRYKVTCLVCGWSLSSLYSRNITRCLFEEGKCPRCHSVMVEE